LIRPAADQVAANRGPYVRCDRFIRNMG